MTQRTRPFRLFPALAAAVALAGALACGSDKSTGPGGNVAGTYNIASTNGPAGTDNSAPFVLFNSSVGADTYRIQIPSGSITLGADKHYTGSGTVELYIDDVLQPDESGDSFPSGGTYSVSGSTVTFTPSDGSAAMTATFSGGNTLTFTESVAPFGTITIVAKK
jgi:hypothetical protein